MRQCCSSMSSLLSQFVACLVLTVCTGIPSLLAAALITPEEVNSVRVYKQMAKSTVLVASAYVSSHHIAHTLDVTLGERPSPPGPPQRPKIEVPPVVPQNFEFVPF